MNLRVKLGSFCPLAAFAFILWSNSSFAPPTRPVSFFCNDTSINKPYHGDSINALNLFISLLCGAAIAIYITEFFYHNEKDESICEAKFKYNMKHFYCGFLYVLVVTEILKISFGELRPHFFQTCQPDVDHVKCSNGLVTKFTCTGLGPKWLIEKDIYKSFPSGHASLSFYTFAFLSLYIHKRPVDFYTQKLFIWKVFVSLLFFTWSVICCISRLLDYRHFWWDVLTGIIIGLFGAFFTINIAVFYKKGASQKKDR